jgi:hypothetical protein
MGVLKTTADCMAARMGLYRKPIFDFPPLQLKQQDHPLSFATEKIP